VIFAQCAGVRSHQFCFSPAFLLVFRFEARTERIDGQTDRLTRKNRNAAYSDCRTNIMVRGVFEMHSIWIASVCLRTRVAYVALVIWTVSHVNKLCF